VKIYWYRAMTPEGSSVRGSGEHADLAELMDTLAAQGLQAYRVWSLPGWYTALFFRPLKPGAVAEFCYLMGQHLRAGADLRLALAEASSSASTARLRMLSGRLKRTVERGQTLAQALTNTRAFPVMVTNLVVVGEETGRLGDILSNAAGQYEQMRQLRSAIQRSLIYPLIVLVILLLSTVFWLLVVIPKMSSLFNSLNVELPVATQRVLAATDWLQHNGWWLPLALAPLVVVLLALAQQPALRPVWHAVRWWAPGLKRLERSQVYHAFFSNLGAMHAAGLTLSRTLTVLVEQPVNHHFGRRLGRIALGAGRGQSLSEGLARSGVFERFALSLIRLGETTGTLDQQGFRLSEHYASRLKQQIETGSRLFEPLILLILAGLLLLIGTTLLGPVYELAARASAGLNP
jgi:type II secretory pathway component PulF